MDLVISRKKWSRGLTRNSYLMLNNNGTMCVLGFYGKALGIDEEYLKTTSPNRSPTFWPSWLYSKSENEISWSSEITSINDSDESDLEIENQLTTIFYKHNIALIFEN